MGVKELPYVNEEDLPAATGHGREDAPAAAAARGLPLIPGTLPPCASGSFARPLIHGSHTPPLCSWAISCFPRGVASAACLGFCCRRMRIRCALLCGTPCSAARRERRSGREEIKASEESESIQTTVPAVRGLDRGGEGYRGS